MACANARRRPTNAAPVGERPAATDPAASGAADDPASLERRNEELESFVRALAHDAGSLTRGIALRAQLLRERLGPTDAETASILCGVEERAGRLGRMSEALLRLARIGAQDLERAGIDLSAMARDVIAELRRDHPDRRVGISVRPGMKAHGDPVLVRLLLENLLGNAWKYTVKSSRARIEFGSRRAGGEAVFYIVDNGIGIGAEGSEGLFSPFVRLAAAQAFPGTGLGLAIAKQIVLRHGGWIRADATAGSGAAFVFSLGPDAHATAAAGAA